MKLTIETTERLVQLNAARRNIRRNVKALAGVERTDMAAELAALEDEIEELVGVPQPRTRPPEPKGWAAAVARFNAQFPA